MRLVMCDALTKSYGNTKALNKVSLEISAGKIVGLLGPNGSGKTTLIKILSGVLKSDQGTAIIDEKEIGVETKKIVSYLPERTYFDSSVKAGETVDFFEKFYEDFDRKRALETLETLQISEDSKIGELSKGNREKLQLVLVMSRRAKLYLLDEPMGGVDPASRDFILRTILQNYEEDASIVISTHLIQDVEKVLDDVIFLKNGEICLHQSVDEIREKENKSVDGLFREVFEC